MNEYMYVCMCACACVCVCVRVNVYVYIKSHQMHAASHVHAPAGLLLKKVNRKRSSIVCRGHCDLVNTKANLVQSMGFA